MGKRVRKRGRPAIKPWVEAFIATRVQDNQNKTLEKQVPVKVLANEIQKEINQQARVQSPKLSTLEKRILYYNSVFFRELDPIDGPWTILSLANPKYNIPPEALQAVISTQAAAIKSNKPFSVREALWMGRFYCIFKGTKFEYESGHNLVEITAKNYARTERICEVLRDTGKLLDEETLSLMLRYDDTLVYYNMTGNRGPQISLIEQIRCNSELSDWFFEDEGEINLSDKEFEEKFAEHLKYLRQMLGKKGAQNEREHKAKKQE
jgi:hypothetical protein